MRAMADVERRSLQIELRVRTMEVKAGGNGPVLNCQYRFDETGYSRCRVEVSDIGLYGSDRAVISAIHARENLCQRCHLDGIAQRRSRAMSLDHRNSFGSNPRGCLGHSDHFGLPVHARGRIPDLNRAIVVDRGSPDHGAHGIAVGNRFRKPLQKHRPHPVSGNGSSGFAIERAAVTVGRCNASLPVIISAALRDRYRHAAGQRHIALVVKQAPACQADRDQGCRAGRLNGHAGAAEIELVGCVRSQVILVVADHHLMSAQQIQQFLVVVDIEKVGADTGPGIDPDRAGIFRRIVAGVFQSLPGSLEKDSLLRIHGLGFARIEPEEPGIEKIHACQNSSGAHVIRIAPYRGVHSGLAKVLVREERNTFDSVPQISPELVEVVRPWKSAAHPDYRDTVQQFFFFLRRRHD